MTGTVQDAFFNTLLYCRQQIAEQDYQALCYNCNHCILKKINEEQCPFYTRAETCKTIDRHIEDMGRVDEHSVLLSAADLAEFCQPHMPVCDNKTGNFYCRDFDCPLVKANHPEVHGPSCPVRFTMTGMERLLAYRNGHVKKQCHKKTSWLSILLSGRKKRAESKNGQNNI